MSEHSTPQDVEREASTFREDFEKVRSQVGRAVVGQTEVVDHVLTCLFTGGHVLLEGVPGIGKTLLIRSLSQALSLSFGRLQFTPDLMPADITGTTIVLEVEGDHGRITREFRFQQGPIFAQMVLADEINRATPKTQAALLEAMQERSVTVAGETHPLPSPFFVMATQNPIEQEGTYPLPEAQLDRFFYKVDVGYASREDMAEILRRTTTDVSITIDPVLDGEGILRHQRLVRRVPVAPTVQDYAIRLVLSTHPKGEFATPLVNDYVRMGASPRAAQAIMLGAKCRALLDGRTAVSIDDLQKVALPALRHRVIMNFEGQAEGHDQDRIIANIIETLPR